jgi:hypothetical protein
MEALSLLWKTAVAQDQRELVAVFQTEMRKRVRPQIAEMGVGLFLPQADPIALRELLDSISAHRALVEKQSVSEAVRQSAQDLDAKAEKLKGSAQLFEHGKQDPFRDADWSKKQRRKLTPEEKRMLAALHKEESR